MQTKRPSPFSGFPPLPPGGGLRGLFSALQPPGWLVDEVQNRVVLFLNHVLMGEPQARERLRGQQGRRVRLEWGAFHLTLAATAAGLVERPTSTGPDDLVVTVAEVSPLGVARTVLAGERPAVDIQGDVQLASELAWLVDNVRWDVEEDLSRFVGDATAHMIVRGAASAARALRTMVGAWPGGGGRSAAPGATTADDGHTS
jgi:ubiquinone biosynthesis protein UbiJ